MRALPKMHSASFVIGGIQLMWAAGFVLSNGGRLLTLLNAYSVKWAFLALLVISGVMCVIGSIATCRRLRHAGLTLTVFTCLLAFMVLLNHNLVGVMSLSLPFVAMSAATVLFLDVRRKPRKESKCQNG